MSALAETSNLIQSNMFNDDELMFRQKFSEYYPGAEIDKMDPDILQELIYNMLEMEVEKDPELIKTKNKTKTEFNLNNKEKNWNKDIVQKNIEISDMLIPEMSFIQPLIHLNGRINGVPVVFMIDTGASMCVTHEYLIEKCCLQHLVDTNEIKYITGAHSTEQTLGKIWCVDVDLEVQMDDGTISFVSIPISIDVSHDINTVVTEESEKMKKMKNAMYNILDNHPKAPKKEASEKNNDHTCKNCVSHDVILGMTFLRSYRANIDFAKRVITLNDNIKLPFV